MAVTIAPKQGMICHDSKVPNTVCATDMNDATN